MAMAFRFDPAWTSDPNILRYPIADVPLTVQQEFEFRDAQRATIQPRTSRHGILEGIDNRAFPPTNLKPAIGPILRPASDDRIR